MEIKIFLIFALTILSQILNLICSDINPYQVLGVSRNADDKKIREAYRKKAKDWHPDRNKSPDATEKFMLINKAYEILSDSERRSLYDDYGTTNEPRQGGGGGGFHQESYDNFFRDFDPFEGFFGGQGFGFNQKKKSRKNPEEEINKRTYEDTILPNSYKQPFLIYTYTEFCFSCIAVENIWQTLKQEVKNVGFGAGHSDASWNRELTKLLEIRTVPSIVAVINGRIYHFRSDFNLKEMREFVRNLIPSKLTVEVNKHNFNSTLLNTINDNKVFSLFITHSSHVSLRYQMPCFQMKNNLKCSSIRLNNMDQEFKDFLSKNFKIPSDLNKQEMLILFKEKNTQSEDVHRPFMIQASTELAYSVILQTFENNKFLIIPRVSSPSKFFDLCPSWSEFDPENARNVICSILIANCDTQTPPVLFDPVLKTKLIKKLQTESFLKNLNIQFTYICSNVQNDFVEKLVKNSKSKFNENNLENKIVVLKRLDDKYANYDFINDLQIKDVNFLEILKNKLSTFRSGASEFRFKMIIPSFYEESNQDFLSMIIEYFENIWDYVTDRLFWERLLGNSSYMMVILCTFLFLWLMMMFSSEKSNPNSATTNYRNKNNQSPLNRSRQTNSKNQSFNESYNQSPSKSSHNESTHNTTLENDLYNSRFDDFNKNTSNQFEIVEMSPKTYAGLISEVPKGFRTILLIVTNENKNQLIDLFTRVCSKYSNKSYRLRFGFLNQNTCSGKKWLDEIIFNKYKQLGDESSSEGENSDDDYEQINSKTIIDLKADCNVLAVNSHQKCYIPMNFRLTDPNESSSSYLNLKRKNSDKSLMEQSIGFEESYSGQMENKFVSELTNWLDKFTEGLLSNKRSLKDWPKMS